MITVISDLTSAKARKFWTALGGVVVLIVSANVLPDQWKAYAEGLLGLMTAFGVYAVPNATTAPAASDPASVKMDNTTAIG